jgi:hypothetical protein
MKLLWKQGFLRFVATEMPIEIALTLLAASIPHDLMRSQTLSP